MYWLIETKYIPATDERGAFIQAVGDRFQKATIPYPYELNGSEAHRAAALELCDKLGWDPTSLKRINGNTRTGEAFIAKGK